LRLRQITQEFFQQIKGEMAIRLGRWWAILGLNQ
jgi:hypothetical protein